MSLSGSGRRSPPSRRGSASGSGESPTWSLRSTSWSATACAAAEGRGNSVYGWNPTPCWARSVTAGRSAIPSPAGDGRAPHRRAPEASDANQVDNLVQIRSGPGATVVRVHMARPPPAVRATARAGPRDWTGEVKEDRGEAVASTGPTVSGSSCRSTRSTCASPGGSEWSRGDDRVRRGGGRRLSHRPRRALRGVGGGKGRRGLDLSFEVHEGGIEVDGRTGTAPRPGSARTGSPSPNRSWGWRASDTA